jgi:hypothetical protein
MRILKAGLLYFVLVFGAGFMLGTVRVLWIVPSVGTRIAELLEAPLMLVVMILAARWVVHRLKLPPGVTARLGAGLVALGLLLAAEFTAVLAIRGLTIREYFASRDPVAGSAYILMLGLFAVMPLLVARR